MFLVSKIVRRSRAAKHVVDCVRSDKSHAATASLISRHFFKKPERRADFAKVNTWADQV